MLLLLQCSQEKRVDMRTRRDRLEWIWLRKPLLLEWVLEGKLVGHRSLRVLRLLLRRILLISSKRLRHSIARLLLVRLAVSWGLRWRSRRLSLFILLLLGTATLVSFPCASSSSATSATTASATASTTTEPRSSLGTFHGRLAGTHHLMQILRASKRCVSILSSFVIVIKFCVTQF